MGLHRIPLCFLYISIKDSHSDSKVLPELFSKMPYLKFAASYLVFLSCKKKWWKLHIAYNRGEKSVPFVTSLRRIPGTAYLNHTLIEKWSRLGIKAGLLSILGSTLTENTGEMNYEQCGAINTPNLVAVKQDLDLYKIFFSSGCG